MNWDCLDSEKEYIPFPKDCFSMRLHCGKTNLAWAALHREENRVVKGSKG